MPAFATGVAVRGARPVFGTSHRRRHALWITAAFAVNLARPENLTRLLQFLQCEATLPTARFVGGGNRAAFYRRARHLTSSYEPRKGAQLFNVAMIRVIRDRTYNRGLSLLQISEDYIGNACELGQARLA